MKAYGIDYIYNGGKYTITVDAKDRDSARNKIGRKHKMNAEQAKRNIKFTKVCVVGYF